MTIREAWENGRLYLTPTSPTPQLDARLLLEHSLSLSHSQLVAHGNDPMPTNSAAAYQTLLDRASQAEPIPYLIGHAPFFEMDLAVSPAVLIPRPETEELVLLAVTAGRQWASPRMVDVGTGSGCIAIALARKLPQAQVTAVDLSPAALTIAQQNASRYAPNRITFIQGSLLEPVLGPFDLIIANLPYVTTAEWTELDDGVKLFEPRLALDGGSDGLRLVRDMLRQAVGKLTDDGVVLLEVGWQQGTAVATFAQTLFPTASITLQPDFAGYERFVIVEKS